MATWDPYGTTKEAVLSCTSLLCNFSVTHSSSGYHLAIDIGHVDSCNGSFPLQDFVSAHAALHAHEVPHAKISLPENSKSSDVQPGNHAWHPTPVDKKEWHQVTSLAYRFDWHIPDLVTLLVALAVSFPWHEGDDWESRWEGGWQKDPGIASTYYEGNDSLPPSDPHNPPMEVEWAWAQDW